jgi:hypothetical protein
MKYFDFYLLSDEKKEGAKKTFDICSISSTEDAFNLILNKKKSEKIETKKDSGYVIDHKLKEKNPEAFIYFKNRNEIIGYFLEKHLSSN